MKLRVLEELLFGCDDEEMKVEVLEDGGEWWTSRSSVDRLPPSEAAESEAVLDLAPDIPPMGRLLLAMLLTS